MCKSLQCVCSTGGTKLSMISFRSSIVERTRAQPLRGCFGTRCHRRPSHAAMRGKLIYSPWLAKWLNEMRFLAGPGYHAVDAALL